jgi:NADPH2:quinone reductase
MKAVFVEKPGGPESLQYADLPKPTPGPGQALVKIEAAGVNFIDIYFRTGLYPAPPPILLGNEGAGTVEAVGPDVTLFQPGDRVAYAMTRGSYADYAVAPAEQLVALPSALDFTAGAAAMLQGMTAHYLVHSTYPVQKGTRCLIHAAAGGMGLLLVQMAKMLDAYVIGTASTDEKAQLATKAGADEVVVYTRENFVDRAKKMDVVYDSVGKTTFLPSMDCLRPRGMIVNFGNASGPAPDISPLLLAQKGSLFLARPSLAHHLLTREELLWRAGDVLGWVKDGRLKLSIFKTYKLADAAQAHRDLEGRHTSGKLILVP